MRFFALPENARFSNKDIFKFLLPVIFETLMVGMLGTLDTLMVSSLGETTVAGVALVNRIDNFVKQFLVALAQGGSVVLAQYIGAKNYKMSATSMKWNIRIVTAIGILVMLIMVVLKKQTLGLFFSGAEADVLKVSGEYFTVTALSYPFLALYYSCTNTYRAMGKSKIPFISMVVMMLINITLKYIFIFIFKLDVFGAALSTLLALLITGVVLLFMLTGRKNQVRLEGMFAFDFDLAISKRILKISLPNGLEQAMFQLGALMIAGLVSGLGTAAIAGDQIARSLTVYTHTAGAGFAATMLMVVGQCMGAGDIEETKMYTKHILKLDYVFTFFNIILVTLPLKWLVSMYNMSVEANDFAFKIMLVYNIGSMLLYPLSFALPAALRGTGDTKFVMFVASASMLLFRICAAYIFVYALDLGVIGTWYAMVSDWLIRSLVFVIRFKHGKWKKNKVI